MASNQAKDLVELFTSIKERLLKPGLD